MTLNIIPPRSVALETGVEMVREDLVELSPPDAMFKVKQVQEIGKLGNSGGSTGPHLHFEIRSPSGKALNPILRKDRFVLCFL